MGIERWQWKRAAVTLGENQAGIEFTREQDQAKVDEIERWADRVAATYNVVLRPHPGGQ